MTIGGSIALIVIGVILRYAVNWSPVHVNVSFVGLSLMVGGAIGLIISLVLLMRRRRSAPALSYRIGSVYAPGSLDYTWCLKGSSWRCGSSAGGVRDD